MQTTRSILNMSNQTKANGVPSLAPFLRKNFKIVIIILVAMLAISSYVAYSLQAMPITEMRYAKSVVYNHSGQYDYVATIFPNTIYFNRSVLGHNEIPYTNIINTINFTFNYRFTCAPNADTQSNISYFIDISLESSDGWKRGEQIVPYTVLNCGPSDISFTETFSVNISRYLDIIRAIEREIGEIGSSYVLKINPQIKIEAKSNNTLISETVFPVMGINFASRSGNIMTFDGLSYKKTDSIGKYASITDVWLSYFKIISIALPFSLAALISYIIMKIRKTGANGGIYDKIMKKYHAIIVESKADLPRTPRKTTIRVEKIEDLVKFSELASQPIIHYQEDMEHRFYVLSGNDLMYEFVLETIDSQKDEEYTLAYPKQQKDRAGYNAQTSEQPLQHKSATDLGNNYIMNALRNPFILIIMGLTGIAISVTALVLNFIGELYTNPVLGPIFLAMLGYARYVGPPVLALFIISLLEGLFLLYKAKRENHSKRQT